MNIVRERWTARRVFAFLIAFGLASAGIVVVGAVPAAATTLTSFSPGSGPVGTVVTVTGSGFTGATAVKFNGVTGTSFAATSDTSVKASVPAAATTGPVSVIVAGVPTTSATNFAVTPAVTLSPATGPPTTNLLASGTAFGANEAVDIYFDSTDQTLVATNNIGTFSNGALLVPALATPGNHTVTAIGRRSGLAAQATFLVRTNWAQFRGGTRRRGVNPYENVLSSANVGQIDLDWNYATGGAVTAPAISGGNAYFGSTDTFLYAVNATTGALVFQHTVGTGICSSPAVVGGAVYFEADNGSVFSLNAKTGTENWSSPAGVGSCSSPAIANGIVYTGDDNGNVRAMNAATGAVSWNFPAPGAPYFETSPAVANGIVYITGDDGHVYALNASTGSLAWNYPGPVQSVTPVIANGLVYVNLQTLNARTGLFAGSVANGVVVGGASPSSPAVASGTVYIGATAPCKAWGANTKTGAAWQTTNVNCTVLGSPIVANGVVYIGASDGQLYGLSAANGALLWRHHMGASISDSPVIADGVLYIGSGDGNLYAFDLAGGTQQASARVDPAHLHPDYSLKVRR